jgi:single-stranded-DNA-specific exonuclease
MIATKQIQGSKYLWEIPQHDSEQVVSLAATYNLSYPLVHALLTRGFTTPAVIDDFLFSSAEKDVFCSTRMKDAQRAVDRINLAVEKQEKILIFGDYDVDGITSSALMMTCLLPLGAQVNFYLPNRAKEGYGLSTKVVERAAANGYKVIITVDNGTAAFEPARKAKELGIDLIITDHHRPHEELPDAFALVNPHQLLCEYPFKGFAGVGVGFKVISLLYQQRGLELPVKAYELLLLGTVADVVPLIKENRYWVRHGLALANKKPSFSFSVLKKNGKVEHDVISSTDIGFCITPQINALGRLEDPRQGVKFLLGTDPLETERVGTVLWELNQLRKTIERSVVEDVDHLIRRGTIDLSQENIICASSNGWPAGVIGLVASRFVAQYAKPTILFHLTADGKAKGSCRSIKAFNMFDALSSCSQHLDQFGGHAMAAGLSLCATKVGTVKGLLEERTRELLKPGDFTLKLFVDGTLTMSDVTKKILSDMQLFEPFGAENSEPKFYISNICLVQRPQLLKDAHVKCAVFAEGVIKPIIFFNRADLYEKLLAQQEKPFSAVVQIKQNHWQGNSSIELIGLDVAL